MEHGLSKSISYEKAFMEYCRLPRNKLTLNDELGVDKISGFGQVRKILGVRAWS